MLLSLYLSLAIFVELTLCNVEKAVFLAPDRSTLPNDASIDNLLLISLNPDHLTVRTYLNATFPTEESAKGTESWLLLEGLTPGQRYEVRVCWLATQPTAFWLYKYTMSDTFETPALLSSLTSYAYARHASMSKDHIDSLQTRRPRSRPQLTSSLLFLQIHAAADYFTMNKTLMQTVPPVLVDIILDPYILNVFPQSLLPTALYIVLIAVVTWFLSAWIFCQLRRISLGTPQYLATTSDTSERKKTR